MSTMTGTITVRNQEFEVSMNPEWGSMEFRTRVNGKQVESKTWKGLQAAIGTELRKADVTVEVRFMDSRTRRIGTATKIHAASKNVMVRWDDGITEQHHGGAVLAPDTDAAELRRLRLVAKEAQNALGAFEHEHRLGDYNGLRALVEEAQRAKAAELEAAEAKGDGVVDLEHA